MVRTEIKFNHINAKKYNRLLSAFKNGTKEYSKISFDNKVKKRTMIGNTIWQNKTISNIKVDNFVVSESHFIIIKSLKNKSVF